MIHAPQDRLTAVDFYVPLDTLRSEWETMDEYVCSHRLDRLRHLYEHLPTRYWLQAEPRLADLGRARIAISSSWQAAIIALRRIAGEWERSRPPLLSCDLCDCTIRGHDRLEAHVSLFHDAPRKEP